MEPIRRSGKYLKTSTPRWRQRGNIPPWLLGIVASTGRTGRGYIDPFYPTSLYGMRKRNPAYAGYCVRVRNGTSNVETDIGFDSSGWCDVAALNSASGGTASLFVVTWYDQGSSAVNVTNSTAATQPRIAASGVVDTMLGKPVIMWRPGGNSCKLSASANSIFGWGTGAWTMEVYCRTGAAVSLPGQNGPMVNMRSGGSGADAGEFFITDPTVSVPAWFNGTTFLSSTSPTTNTDYAFACSYVGGANSSLRIFMNGASTLTTNVTNDLTASRQLTIGNDSSGSFKDYIGEVALTKGTCLFTSAFTPRSYL